MAKNPTRFSHVKNRQTIFGVEYRLFALTYILNAHFFAVFRHEKKYYMYDGMHSDRLFDFKEPKAGAIISTLWYTMQM